MARPPKLDRSTQAKIVDMIRQGNYSVVAARAAGVSESTFYRWLADDRPRYREFREAVERASAEAEADAVAKWTARMPVDHRAAAAWLARRFPARWSERSEAREATVPEVLAAKSAPKMITVDREVMDRVIKEVLKERRRANGEEPDPDLSDFIVEETP